MSMFDPDLEPSIFDVIDGEADRLSLERAEADVAAGRVIPHERVREWLLSWGKPDELPPPTCDE